MLRVASIGLVLGLAFAGGAHAATASALPALAGGDSAIIQVGEGCGPGYWRAPDNRCRPFRTPYGYARGTAIECPPGWHIGEGRARCWPNR